MGTRKKLRKLNKQAKTQFPGYAIFLVIIIIVVSTKYFVGCSVQDMENSAFRDEQNQAILPVITTANVKQTIAYAFDPEAVIAQQIERTVSYRAQTRIDSLLRNVQDNLQYNRNKVAVQFYLAYAYERTGNTPNAVALYESLRRNYEDRHVVVYIFNAPRDAGDKRDYSVSLVAETLLRQALITNDDSILQDLSQSTAVYGEDGAESLSYAALAKYNLQNKEKRLSSADMYFKSIIKEE